MRISTTASIKEHIKFFWSSFYDISEINEFEPSQFESIRFIKILEANGLSIIESHNNTGTVLYLSDNIAKFGINRDAFLKEGISYFYEYIIPSQKYYPVIVTNLLKKVYEQWQPSEFKSMKFISVGLRFGKNDHDSCAICNRVQFTHCNKNDMPTRSQSLMQDITHLLKDDNYWIRVWNDENPSHVIFHHSNSDLKFSGDLLTKRETEVLKWIVKGKNADEIAQELEISQNTVNIHRQNMLDKFCVKDTTALITLANLTNFGLLDEK